MAGVKRLYLDRLLLGHGIIHEPVSPRAEELLVTQRIVAAVERVYRTQPERAAAFAAKLDAYEGWLRRLRISDEHLALFPEKKKLAGQSIGWAIAGGAGRADRVLRLAAPVDSVCGGEGGRSAASPSRASTRRRLRRRRLRRGLSRSGSSTGSVWQWSIAGSGGRRACGMRCRCRWRAWWPSTTCASCGGCGRACGTPSCCCGRRWRRGGLLAHAGGVGGGDRGGERRGAGSGKRET